MRRARSWSSEGGLPAEARPGHEPRPAKGRSVLEGPGDGALPDAHIDPRARAIAEGRLFISLHDLNPQQREAGFLSDYDPLTSR
jgi:hypothetical protein